jgi:hypothetical protein
MKVKELIKKLHEAIIGRDGEQEKKIWFKILKKSLKHKKTFNVK